MGERGLRRRSPGPQGGERTSVGQQSEERGIRGVGHAGVVASWVTSARAYHRRDGGVASRSARRSTRGSTTRRAGYVEHHEMLYAPSHSRSTPPVVTRHLRRPSPMGDRRRSMDTTAPSAPARERPGGADESSSASTRSRPSRRWGAVHDARQALRSLPTPPSALIDTLACTSAELGVAMRAEQARALAEGAASRPVGLQRAAGQGPAAPVVKGGISTPPGPG